LTENKTAPKQLAKYLTKEIITSPFNKMPDAKDNKYFLLLGKNYFYALSWMIAELGNLKDNGLHIIALKEALQQTSGLSEAAAFKTAYQLAGKKQEQLQALLDKAEGITKIYFEEHNLEHLVVGTSKVK
jgi:galactokinase